MNDINKHLAKLDGNYFSTENIRGENTTYIPDYTTDMNLLMPLAWKYGISVTPETSKLEQWFADEIFNKDGPCFSDADPVKAIIDCLMQIEVNDE